jgi:tyrosyl-tRNA synthetase
MEGIVHIEYSKEKLQTGIDAVSFLAETTIFPSKGEARKMIQNGGISINRIKIATVDEIINDKKLLHKKYLLVQKGKKNYYLINAK